MPEEKQEKEVILIFLVVAKNFGTSGSRFGAFNKIEGELRKTKEYYELKEKKLGTLVSPVPLIPDEIKKNISVQWKMVLGLKA